MASIQSIFSTQEKIVARQCKIWFCAHPDDYSSCMHSVTADLFAARDCVVYYDEEPKADYDGPTLLADLQRMNLFIVPVTARFLRDPNRALDVEFRYAMANGIPVLPLLQEPDLEEDFNETCGTLHCLRAFGEDRENGVYGEKLKEYLDKMFGSHYLKKQIRAEFDASVFLSYRKVDREYMLSLIHTIHGAEACRDVAIWYDDFLVPGENFNAEIQKALEDSDAFVLAVTPHILDKNEQGKKNYVVGTEYPNASAAHKRIVPVRMAPVSQKKLESALRPYPVPECVKPQNGQMLSRALQAALSPRPLGKKKETPRHAYLIGLAYLQGLNGEIDRSRALSLIEWAANRGYAPAMEQIISMYNNGEGVAVDYAKSLEWQRKLVAHWKHECRRDYTLGNLIQLAQSVFDLTKRVLKDEMRELLEELLAMIEGSSVEHALSIYTKGIAARCCKDLALYHEDHVQGGDRELVASYLFRALEFYEDYVQAATFTPWDDEADDDGMDGMDPDVLLGLVEVYEALSRLGLRRESDVYVDYTQKAIMLLEQLTDMAKRNEYFGLLATLQAMSAKYQSPREREHTLQSTMDLCRSSVKTSPTIANKRDLVSTIYNMSLFRLSQASLGSCKHVPSILERNKEEIVARQYGSDYAMPSQITLLREATAYAQEAFDLCEEVAELTGEARDLRMVAILCNCIGDLAQRLEDAEDRELPREESQGDRYLPTYQRIRPYYDRAVDALERLVCLTDLVSDYDLLISVLQDRAFRAGEVVHRGAGDQHYLELELVDRLRILELCHVLYEKTGLEKYERDRDFLYYTVGDLYESLGNPEKAVEYKSKTTFDPWDWSDSSEDPKN